MKAPTIDVPHAHYSGLLLSAGQPDEAALRQARDAGYAMVIDLRTPGEFTGFDERIAVESLGMEYRQIPVAGADGVTEGNARAFQDALRDAGPRPVLAHCGTANRVGALVALGHALEGADTERALQAGRDAGLLGLEAHVRSLLDART